MTTILTSSNLPSAQAMKPALIILFAIFLLMALLSVTFSVLQVRGKYAFLQVLMYVTTGIVLAACIFCVIRYFFLTSSLNHTVRSTVAFLSGLLIP